MEARGWEIRVNGTRDLSPAATDSKFRCSHDLFLTDTNFGVHDWPTGFRTWNILVSVPAASQVLLPCFVGSEC